MSAGAPFPHCGAAHGASGGPRAGPEPPTCAALGPPARQRTSTAPSVACSSLRRSLESSSSAAHTLCTVDTAYCAAATAVTAMGSPSLALSEGSRTMRNRPYPVLKCSSYIPVTQKTYTEKARIIKPQNGIFAFVIAKT